MNPKYKYNREYLHRKLKEKKTARVKAIQKTIYMSALKELTELEQTYIKVLLSRDNYSLQYEIE